ncbi:MAG: hypothetical protein HY331_10430 [Chloroflexi bacterium]|nr:hypothetical protein [Chloroflexota bacterium]
MVPLALAGDGDHPVVVEPHGVDLVIRIPPTANPADPDGQRAVRRQTVRAGTSSRPVGVR